MHTSGSKKLLMASAAMLMPIISMDGCVLPAWSADQTELQTQTPKSDDTPLRLDRPKEDAAPSEQSATDLNQSKLHKLEVSKQGISDEVNDQGQALNGEAQDQNPQNAQIQIGGRGIQIFMQSFTIRTSTATINNMQIDPFMALRAVFGGNGMSSKAMRKLYAERDTGYGVCGLALNVPLGHKGYAKILKTFPSMPAEAADIHAGDVVISVNGKSTLDIAPAEVWDWFTGMPGTEVKLQMSRNDQPFDVTLRRMDIGRIPDFSTRAEFLTLYRHNGVSKFVQN